MTHRPDPRLSLAEWVIGLGYYALLFVCVMFPIVLFVIAVSNR